MFFIFGISERFKLGILAIGFDIILFKSFCVEFWFRLLLFWFCLDFGDRVLFFIEIEVNVFFFGWELMRFLVDFNSFKVDEVVFCMLDVVFFCKV